MTDSVESLQERCRSLEAECHTLLNRAIQSEQQHADAGAERDRYAMTCDALKEEKLSLQARFHALENENQSLMTQLAEQSEAGGDRDTTATLEQERANAKRANELRINLETNFAELSVQFEVLQGEHETLRFNYKTKCTELDNALANIETLDTNCTALERAASAAADERDSATKALNETRTELAKEKKTHDKCKDDLRKTQNSMVDLRAQFDGLQVADDKLKRDYEALKKKAALWKKQAELSSDLQLRNEQLVAQFSFSQKEVADAKKEISRLQAMLVDLEEEEKARKNHSISPKTLQFLRDQLAEANEKLRELRAKEKRWADDKTALEQQVKRLKFELGKKNPSQLRLMEMEVQNELLLGMLQHTNSPPRVKPSTIPKPRPGARKLPPLGHPASEPTSPTPAAAAAAGRADRARSRSITPPPTPPRHSAPVAATAPTAAAAAASPAPKIASRRASLVAPPAPAAAPKNSDEVDFLSDAPSGQPQASGSNSNASNAPSRTEPSAQAQQAPPRGEPPALSSSAAATAQPPRAAEDADGTGSEESEEDYESDEDHEAREPKQKSADTGAKAGSPGSAAASVDEEGSEEGEEEESEASASGDDQ
jgi:hypothetical protein